MASSIFLTLIVVILNVITCCKSEETCMKIDTCLCMLNNGSTVGLWAVDGHYKPRFTGIPEAAGRTFDWNPCTPFSTALYGCSNVMACQFTYDYNYAAGTEDTTFYVDCEGNVVIVYGSSTDSSGYTRQSKVTLKCDPNEPGNGTIPFFTGTALSPGTALYSGTFTSKFVCAVPPPPPPPPPPHTQPLPGIPVQHEKPPPGVPVQHEEQVVT